MLKKYRTNLEGKDDRLNKVQYHKTKLLNVKKKKTNLDNSHNSTYKYLKFYSKK